MSQPCHSIGAMLPHLSFKYRAQNAARMIEKALKATPPQHDFGANKTQRLKTY
jgi:hypothetical protein